MKSFAIIISTVVLSVIAITYTKKFTPDKTNLYQKVNSQILEKFSSYPIVAIGEGYHNSALTNLWLKTLIAEKTFPDKVNNIVVEFGASRYQAIMDNFVNGKEVPDSLFRKCWRETTQLITWDHQVYEEFFREVRRINQGLPKNKKVRVLLGDPTFDETFKINRDDNAFWIVEKEVLLKNQTALIIYGDMHLVKKDIHSNYTNDSLWLVQQLEKKYPGKTFNIWTSLNTNNLAISDIIHKEKITKPAFLHTSQTALGNLDFANILPFQTNRNDTKGKLLEVSAYKTLAMKDNFGGILYLGSWEETSYVAPRLATVYDDSLYVNELIRRASTRKDVWKYQLVALLFEKTKRSKPYTSFMNAVQTADSANIRKEYNHVLTRFPEFHLLYAGYDLMQQKLPKQAIIVYELGIKEHPTDAYLHQLLADAYAEVGENSKAIKCYQEAIKLNPGAIEAKNKLENIKKKS